MTSRWAIPALAIGAFAIGVTEFSPMGLLPDLANGLGVSIPAGGLLISAYALGVMGGAPLMTLAMAQLRPRAALIALMGVFTLGNLLSAVAPDYIGLMGSRVLTSLCHGAFFGIGSVVAARLAPKGRESSAIAAMFMGLTLANVGGVPAATFIGQQIGWRLVFAGTAGLGVLTIVAIMIALPRGEVGKRLHVRRELKVLTRPAVLAALATTVLSSGAMFSLYTYVAPLLSTVTGAAPAFVTPMLVAIGLGFTLGNWAGGRMADRSVNRALLIVLSAQALLMIAFPVIGQTQSGAAILLLLWGAASFGAVPPLQMRVMRSASEAPGLASSINIGAFNLGNALGAALGAGAIGIGLPYAAVPPLGALLVGGALALTVLGHVFERRSAPAGIAI